MRFSVECAFPHLRKRGVASRKDAVCARALTEKRILRRTNDAVRDAAVQGATDRCHRQMPPHSCAMPTSGDVNLDDMPKTPQVYQTCLHTPRSREAPSLVPSYGYLHAIPQPEL